MKTLVAEDDRTSRLMLQKLLSSYGDCHAVENGKEAVDAFRSAKAAKNGYNLVCLDIVMPEMDGQTALKQIRTLEQNYAVPANDQVKVIMTTALDDVQHVMAAYQGSCDAYLIKPFDPDKLLEHLKRLKLIGESS
jgi:two-component system chemotaxis response regulator CheY